MRRAGLFILLAVAALAEDGGSAVAVPREEEHVHAPAPAAFAPEPPAGYVVAGTITAGVEARAKAAAPAEKEPAIPLDKEPTDVKLSVQSVGVYSPADLEKISSHIKKQEEVMKKLEAKVTATRKTRAKLALVKTLMNAYANLRKVQKFYNKHVKGIAHYNKKITLLGQSATEIGERMKQIEEEFARERAEMAAKLASLKARLQKAVARRAHIVARRATVAELLKQWKAFTAALKSVYDSTSGIKKPAVVATVRTAGAKMALPGAPPPSDEAIRATGITEFPRFASLRGAAAAAAARAAGAAEVDAEADADVGVDAAEAAEAGEVAAAAAELSMLTEELRTQRAAVAAEIDGGADALEHEESAANAALVASADAEGAELDAEAASMPAAPPMAAHA